VKLHATGSVPPASGELAPGTRVGRYVVLKRLGRGGMSVVYMAYDEELDRRVALKLLKSASREGSDASSGTQRLLREAQAMARLSHSNVASIFDVGTLDDDQVFLAMEYVDGVTLRKWQEAQGRSVRDIVKTYVQAGRGLEAAHAAGILHRDFKPENVIVDTKGRAKVLDFGVARFDSTAALPEEVALATTGIAASLSSHAPLTYVGTLIGTPQYMAPEQLRGDRAETRSDQFAFCVALYEALFGVRPFQGMTVQALLAAIVGQQVKPPPRGRRVPKRVRLAITRGLSASVDSRWPTLGELLDALERGVSRRRRGLLGGAVAVVVLLASALLFARARGQPRAACDGVDTEIQQTWGPLQRAQVEAAFTSSHDPRSANTLPRVINGIDAYAATWGSMRMDSCRATHVRFEQSDEAFDLRAGCLQQKRTTLGATISLLEKADPPLVQRSVDVVLGLPDIAECADVPHLKAPYALPHDSAQRAKVEAARELLARADAADLAMRFEQVGPLLDRALDIARELHSAQLEGAALLVMGDSEMKRSVGDPQPHLLQAALDANGARDDETEAMAWMELFFIVGLAPDKHSATEVDLYERLAEAAMGRAGSPDRLRSMLENNRGNVSWFRGQLDDAEAHFREAVKLKLRTRPVAEMYETNLATLLGSRGRTHEAEALLADTLSRSTQTYGEDDPRLAHTLVEIAGFSLELGHASDALRAATRAREVVGADPEQDAWALLYVAEAQLLAGDKSNAFMSAGLALSKLAALNSEVDTAHAHLEWATLLLRRRYNLEAQREATLAASSPIPSDRTQAMALHALATLRIGGSVPSPREAEDAMARLDGGQPTDGPDAFVPSIALGEAALSVADADRALTQFERANRIADAMDAPLEYIADAHFGLARALRASRTDPARAKALAERAAGEYEGAPLPAEAKRAHDFGQ
jgi:serine/threonine protein kinase/tetratricopeptide (TPR) repeat protein